MTFPSTYEIIKHFNVFLISGPIMIIVSISFWFIYFFRVRRWSSPTINFMLKARDHSDLSSKRRRIPSYALTIAIFTMIIGGGHLLIYFQVASAFRFRINPTEVNEIRITEYEEHLSETSRRQIGESLVIRDKSIICEGLKKLNTSRSFQTDHEHYIDQSYRINFIFCETSKHPQCFLWLHDKTQRRDNINVVIPCISDRGNVINRGGEYSSPEFHEWFEKEILPRMKNNQGEKD